MFWTVNSSICIYIQKADYLFDPSLMSFINIKLDSVSLGLYSEVLGTILYLWQLPHFTGLQVVLMLWLTMLKIVCTTSNDNLLNWKKFYDFLPSFFWGLFLHSWKHSLWMQAAITGWSKYNSYRNLNVSYELFGDRVSWSSGWPWPHWIWLWTSDHLASIS